MLRSHHLCCVAIHVEKTCEARSSENREGVSRGGMAEMQVTHGVIALDSDALHLNPGR